jgi:Bacterial Ig-like domain (group 3)
VVTGNGDGTFDAPVSSAIDIAPQRLAIGFFDLGNTPDVLAMDDGLSRLVLYTNDGNGALQEAARIPATGSSLAAADVDGDASTDALIGAADGDYYAYYGNGNGTFGAPVRIRGDGYPAIGIRAAHTDTNGLLDVFAFSDYRLSIVRNLGSRSYGDPATYSHYNSSTGRDFEVGDLTGDGIADAVTLGRDCSMRTYGGSGLGTFPNSLPAFYGTCYNPGTQYDADLDLGDFDGDGRPDVLTTPVVDYRPGYNPAVRDGVKVYRNLCGDGELEVTVDTPVINPGGTATIKTYVRPTDDNIFSYYAGTGTATLEQDGQSVATAPFVSGLGTFPRSGLPLGTHTYTVSYGGDPQYEPIGSTGPVTIRVTSDTTTTTLSVDPMTSTWGASPPPNMTVTVTSSTGSVPSGKIEMTLDGKKICFNDCTAPTVSLPVWGGISVGTHTVTARFLGDANHPPSVATDVTYTIVKHTPTINVTPTAGRAGAPFDVNASVTGADYTLSGTLTLYNGATPVDSVPASHYCCNSILTVPALPEGQHKLRLAYSGDANHNAVERLVTFTIFPSTGSWVDARGTAANITVGSVYNDPVYEGRRKRAGDPWGMSDSTFYTGSWTDTTAVAGTVYLYRLQNSEATMTSNVDVAQRISFTDDPLAAGTTIRAVHLQEIVAGTNALRTAAGLTPLPSSAYASGAIVTASGLNVLRNAINEARSTLGATPVTFTSTIAAGGIVRAAHIQELREAIR